MAIGDIPVLKALTQKLKFHEQRQRVLADNVANASTPGFHGRDVQTPDFFRMAAEVRPGNGVLPVATAASHLPGHLITNAGAFTDKTSNGYEITPDGNEVVLEEQMIKVADNQMEYQVATSLYQRSLDLMRTALGKK